MNQLHLKPARSRLTVVESIYYAQPGQQPVIVEAGYGRWIDSEEQRWFRLLTVGEEWKPLDTGWITDASLLSLKNKLTDFAVNPTEAERSEAQERILEVCVRNILQADMLVYPGESMRVRPVGPIHVRCQKGETKIVLSLFPM